MIPSEYDDFVVVPPSPAKEEGAADFDDVDAEFQQAISGVALQHKHARIVSMDAGPSSLVFQGSRPSSPFVRSVSELRYSSPSPASRARPKSCLIRSMTPQAPGPPRMSGDGMQPLRVVRSNDRETCFARRRRADGVPVFSLHR